MASNREERRLQRQRGAARHEVRDVDFGPIFQTAAVPQPPGTRTGVTPQAQVLSQPPSQQIPTSSSRGGSSSANVADKPITPAATATVNDANTSAKRRKLDVAGDVPASSRTRNTRSRGTPMRDLDDENTRIELAENRTPWQTLQEDDELAQEIETVKPTTPKAKGRKPVAEMRADEITESPRDAPGSGHRQRASLHKAQSLGARLQGALTEENPSAKPSGRDGLLKTRQRSKVVGANRTEQSPELSHRRSPRFSQPSSAADEVDELSPEQPKTSRRTVQREIFSDVEVEEHEEADAIDDIEAADHLNRKGKRRRVEDEREEEADEDGSEEADEPMTKPAKKPSRRKKTKSKASPAAQRQPKTSKSGPPAQKSHGTIPVIVHRLTKPIVYGEDDTDADILNESVPFAKRSGVNAVDVLSQFCEEIIESGLAALEEGGSNAENSSIRREYRTKLRAVEAFQEELRTRLLELTVVLDTDYLLNKRVRAAQKEKIQLREELLRLRAEREQIALRTDEVRIKHENSRKEAQEQATLNASLHDIELAVSLGREKTPAGVIADRSPPDLSTLLNSVAGQVSNKSAQGGILRQVKEFNAFLERAALALEGRT